MGIIVQKKKIKGFRVAVLSKTWKRDFERLIFLLGLSWLPQLQEYMATLARPIIVLQSWVFWAFQIPLQLKARKATFIVTLLPLLLDHGWPKTLCLKVSSLDFSVLVATNLCGVSFAEVFNFLNSLTSYLSYLFKKHYVSLCSSWKL